MSTSPVPAVRNIVDLRKGWPEWHFLAFHFRNRHKDAEWPRLTIYQAFRDGHPDVISPHKRYAAEAAQALAEWLAATGYKAKEKT